MPTILIEIYLLITCVVFQLVEKFSAPGSYNIRVNVSNGLASESALVKVLAIFPITEASVHVAPVIINTSSVLEVELNGSGEILLRVDFGDNSEEVVVSSENGTLNLEALGLANGIPRYRCVVRHRYRAVGTYRTTVDVSNRVSRLVKYNDALVEEAISGITISSNSPHAMPLRSVVVVTVTVANGNSLTFDWFFSYLHRSSTQVERWV